MEPGQIHDRRCIESGRNHCTGTGQNQHGKGRSFGSNLWTKPIHLFGGSAAMELLQSTLLAHLIQVPKFRHARGQRLARHSCWSGARRGSRGRRANQHAGVGQLGQRTCRRVVQRAVPGMSAHPEGGNVATAVGAHRSGGLGTVGDELQPGAGSSRCAGGRDTSQDGELWRGQAPYGRYVRSACAHGTHTLLVSLVRHGSVHVLGQTAVDRTTNDITQRIR